MNNGGDNYQTFVLWSLEDATFLDTLYYKNLNTSKEIQIKDKTFNWVRKKGNLKLEKGAIVFEMDSIITFHENDELKDTLSFGRCINKIRLK
jgi:hypothetical protein